MAIETYLVDEMEKTVLSADDSEEWKKIVNELDLEGQKSLVDGKQSPVPFQIMNTQMTRVYETLCPKHDKISEFRHGAIPLKVLSLIALAEREGYFHEIHIWHNESNPDPIAVGTLTKEYNSNKYIIARWGDELASFPELLQKAKERFKAEAVVRMSEHMSDAKQKLENMDNIVEKHFQGGWVSL